MSMRRDLSQLPLDLCKNIASFLPLVQQILEFSSTCNAIHYVCSGVIDESIAEDLEGLGDMVAPRKTSRRHQWVHRLDVWRCLRPWKYVSDCKERWPDCTVPFRFTLDTEGPLGVEMYYVVADAPNCSPSVGFIDAAAERRSRGSSGGITGDLSRSRKDPDLFAIGFHPESGLVSATAKARFAGDANAKTEESLHDCEYFQAQVNWQKVGDRNQERIDDDTGEINTAMIVALFVENGRLTIYRMFRPGRWQSSGVVCQNLPATVVPCVFMSSFGGLAEVAFKRLWTSRPYLCPCCDNRGFSKYWEPVTSSQAATTEGS